MDVSRVVVVGLGYVGLPLAVALSRRFEVVGYDVDSSRIEEIGRYHDRTGEVGQEELAVSSVRVTSKVDDCRGANVYIVTVPTPVDTSNEPDLGPVIGASRMVGSLLERESQIVVYESTVYPGVTEEICGPILEQESGLRCGIDFFLGYSPERINPGDREHRVDRIVKVVAGQTPEVTERLAAMYGAVITAGVFRAASIKAAEAAKVIENAQRDINIAFMNEVTQIFSRLSLSIWDVLDAARTKWNFLPFEPGLVGGHCIGIDPYYLSFRSQQLGHDPEVILAGRSTNDGMGKWVADALLGARGGRTGSILVMGLTFKENVPDLRNSRVVDVIRRMREQGHSVSLDDPMADPEEARREYGLEIERDLSGRKFDVVFAAVPHDQYRSLTRSQILDLILPGGCIADLKGIWRHIDFGEDVQRWSL